MNHCSWHFRGRKVLGLDHALATTHENTKVIKILNQNPILHEQADGINSREALLRGPGFKPARESPAAGCWEWKERSHPLYVSHELHHTMVRPPFKNRNYLKKAARKRTLKQIVATITNQARKGPASAGTFVSVKAGESAKFKFKYSDISGLKAKYRDPKTGLRFASTEEFKRISKLTPVEVRDFLAFRGGVETRAF